MRPPTSATVTTRINRPRMNSQFMMVSPSSLLANDSVRMPGAAQRRVVGDQAFAVQIVQTTVHQVHAFPASGLNRVLELMNLVFADEIAHRAVSDDQFVSQDPPRAVGRRQ